MSKLIWDIVGNYENCHMPHILIEERKHEDAIESIFTCLDCLEEGIRKAEQERIIKLLDIWDCNNDRCDCDSINECIYRQDLIKLINGKVNA